MANGRGTARRRIVRVGVAVICAATLMLAAMDAGATVQVKVHGSATGVNPCIATLEPALQPPSDASATVTISTDAFPDPHNGDPITLSNTNVGLSIPGAEIQLAVAAGLINDGVVVPTNIVLTLAGSNTVEATHVYSVHATVTVHVVGGVAQPLTADAVLADTTWTPLDATTPVFITEQSLRVEMILSLVIGVITLTTACTPSGLLSIVTLHGATSTTTTTVAPTSTTMTTVAPTTVAPTTTTVARATTTTVARTTTTTVARTTTTTVAPTSTKTGIGGYWMLDADGRVYPFGAAVGFPGVTPAATAIAPRRDGKGYWIVDAFGHVFAYGTAHSFGGSPPMSAGEFASTISATPTGKGYWIFSNTGRAFPFGDASSYGDMSGTRLNGPIVSSVSTPTGHGYYMVGSDGGIFTFGDARFHGSTGNLRLNRPVVGMAPTPDGKGYWLVATDGGVFAFNAPFRGSMGGTHLNRPVDGIVAYGNGYLMAGSDGGIFDFSNQRFKGSLATHPPTAPIIGLAAVTRA